MGRLLQKANRLVITVVLRLCLGLKPPVEFKAQIPVQTPRVADLLGLGWSRIWFSNKFPGDSNAAGQGSHFENHWVKGMACFHSLKNENKP